MGEVPLHVKRTETSGAGRQVMHLEKVERSLDPKVAHPTPHSLQPSAYSLQLAAYTLHHTPYTPQPTPYTRPPRNSDHHGS